MRSLAKSEADSLHALTFHEAVEALVNVDPDRVGERLSDGTVKRTIAVSPAGELMAEYPDQQVTDVNRDGKPIYKPDTAIVHKQGNWW